MSPESRSAKRPTPDQVFSAIADYVLHHEIRSEAAVETAILCLMDTLACAVMALKFPACMQLLGPVVPGATLKGGARVPGTSYELDPVNAAFNIGTMIRWLGFNDTWPAVECGHPSDNLGGILATADFLARAGRPVSVRDLLHAVIKAYEIQGILALDNGFERVGLDQVLLVKVASTAVVTALLGGSREQLISAVSSAWLDGAALGIDRPAPDTGSRRSWAAGDATSRAVRLALLALKGDLGYPAAAQPVTLAQPFGTYVMENVLFKLSPTAELRAHTAVEAALSLHLLVSARLTEVERVVLATHAAQAYASEGTGVVAGSADRDDHLQTLVATTLICGQLPAAEHRGEVAADARVDALRARVQVTADLEFTGDHHAPERRARGSALQVFFNNGDASARVQIDYPIGHRRRRAEAVPLLKRKFESGVSAHFGGKQAEMIKRMFDEPKALLACSVADFMAKWVSAA